MYYLLPPTRSTAVKKYYVKYWYVFSNYLRALKIQYSPALKYWFTSQNVSKNSQLFALHVMEVISLIKRIAQKYATYILNFASYRQSIIVASAACIKIILRFLLQALNRLSTESLNFKVYYFLWRVQGSIFCKVIDAFLVTMQHDLLRMLLFNIIWPVEWYMWVVRSCHHK